MLAILFLFMGIMCGLIASEATGWGFLIFSFLAAVFINLYVIQVI